MLRPIFSRRVVFVCLSAVSVALLVPAAASAQADSVGSFEQLVPAYRQHRNRFESLSDGMEQPGAEDNAVLDTLAKWYVFPMTLTQDKRNIIPELKNRNIRDLAAALDLQLKSHALLNASKNQEFMKQWTERMIAAFQTVYTELRKNPNGNRIALVGTSLLLPVYAKTKQQKFAEYLQAQVLDEKQHEIVKLYALKALQEYGAARAHKASDDFSEEPELPPLIARDTRRVETLLKSTGRKWDGTDPAVARFIRRAAIRALAETRVPAMDVLKDGKVVAPVAYTLLRVLTPGKDGLTPLPSLSEKFEAAVGIARMHGKHIDAYLPEPGLYLLGQFVTEFVNEYTKDYPNFGGKNLKKEERKVPAQPWKKMAGDLSKALKEVQTGIRDNHPAYAKAGKLAEEAQRLLAYIQTHSAIPDTAGITRATNALLPPSGALFKGNKEYQVPVGPLGGD